MIGRSFFTKLLLWLSLGLLVGSYICLPVNDPDLWWHITIGRWIVAHQRVPLIDYWNMFSTGELWRAYSWSNEIVLAVVDQTWGGVGLAVAQIVLGVGLALSLQYIYGRMSRDYFIGALIGTYAAVATFNNFTLRPQVIVWVLFGAVILMADEISEKGFSPRRGLALLALGCVWANTHLTAILGLGAIVLWLFQSSHSQFSVGRTVKASSSFFVGTLITPYLGGEWLTFFHKSGHPLKFQAIAEFQPATILQFSSVFVLLLVFLLLVVSYTTRALPTLSRAVLAAGMLLAGLTAVKFLPFAVIVWGAMFAVWWRDSGRHHRTRIRDNFAEGLLVAKEGLWKLSTQTGGAIAFVTLSISAVNIAHLLRTPLNTARVPKNAVDFIEEHNLAHPLLNEFGTGGYLMYRFSDERGEPRYKVAIDGRTNVNPDAIWNLYRASFSGRANWSEFIDKVGAKTILWRQGSPFTSLLLLSPDWCRVFTTGSGDEDQAVFIRYEDFRSRAGELTSIDCQ